ncbi:hypothetical protein BGW80DRAFT_1255484 [Lactifluus volemus]|nr:hypothetical protein BGW80DRAFT_1255484 [Lactifluus volemus]
MSNTRKALTVDKLEDLTLGAFSNLRPSETLDHLIRYLSTWNGSDKLFMLLCSQAAKLASIISDARTLWGIWARSTANSSSAYYRAHARMVNASILPPPPYLLLPHSRPHSSPPISTRWKLPSGDYKNESTAASLSLWSSRFWAVYVILQLAHLREDRALLVKRHRALKKLSLKEKLQPEERAELAHRWDAWYNELAVNLSYLPMTIHW